MKKFFLEIITPEKVFFSGEVEMVTLPSVAGSVSILATHQPMVLATEPGLAKIHQKGKISEAFISEGFAEVRPEATIILAQAVEWPEDIDEMKALRTKEIAESAMRKKISANEYKVSQAALQRAFARLKVKSRYDGK